MAKGHRMAFGTGIIGWVAERGEHILANDVRREPRFMPSALSATLSELAVPVRLTGEVVAVLNVESDRLDAFDEGDVVALDGIASQVAAAIQNARLFDEKVRALRNLEILQEITNVLNSDLELDVLLERIARRSVEAVRPAQMGAVLLYDGESLRVRSSFGYLQPAALGKVQPGLPRRAARQRVRERARPPGGLGRRASAAGPRGIPPSARRPEASIRAARCASPSRCRRRSSASCCWRAPRARTTSRSTTSASPPPWPRRPPSRWATRCACGASWRWTGSGRSTSRTSATSCAAPSP